MIRRALLSCLFLTLLPSAGCAGTLPGMSFEDADGIVRAPAVPERTSPAAKLDPVVAAKRRP